MISTSRLALLGCVLICHSLPAAEDAPNYSEHQDLSYYLDVTGQKPIKTKEDWQIRRGHILANLHKVMGDLPRPEKAVPLEMKVLEVANVGKLVHKKVSYHTDSTEQAVTAHLFLPPGDVKVPAILCLHQTTGIGKGEPAGLGGNPNLHYALHLAQRGYITLAPDYPSFGDYKYDFDPKHGYKSGSMKAVYDNIRAIDLLVSLPRVDADRIGCIGHSLGGHNTIFTAVHDSRIKVAVSNCGFTRFHKYYEGKLAGWTSARYMPLIAGEYGNNPGKVPFDFPELIAALAPRAFLASSPVGDSNFEVSGVKDTIAAARPVFKLLGAEENLAANYPDCAHDFPEDVRKVAYEFLDKHLKKQLRSPLSALVSLMSLDLRRRIFEALDALVLIDPHTHINPLSPASTTLADILGYHYYTELAHSAGMSKEQIEEPGLDPKEKVHRLIAKLGPINNTIQFSWLVEMAQKFFDFTEERVTLQNWEPLYDAAAAKMAAPDWPQQVLEQSKLEAIFLTNDFDDPLAGFDTNVYIPCLRTDDLVFHLCKPEVQNRLANFTRMEASSTESARRAIAALFNHFKANNARACAISLPPDFSPAKVSDARANTALAALYQHGTAASDADKRAAANFVFWTLAEMCAEHALPFDLMIGVNRGVYEAGVHQGRDLYDSRVSLIQYKQLFNAFPQVTFPISVLASVTNQELTSYAWIFPNVVTNGHWWYSNTPTFIEHDLACRLEAVPRTKQIGYYSDMYKLEFALPKFAMYKRILAKVLAERFCIDRNWSEERAVDFGAQILRGNVEAIFFA